jgi:hypothetical protein
MMSHATTDITGQQPIIQSSEITSKTLHTNNERCKCGCIPNILSMFEMAELRSKRRAEILLLAKNKIILIDNTTTNTNDATNTTISNDK